MKISDTVKKDVLDHMVSGHNGEKTQKWGRTLKADYYRGNIEVVGVCTFGNLYFCQFTPEGNHRIDWIRKSDAGEKYSNVLPEHFRVSDGTLDKFRNKL